MMVCQTIPEFRAPLSRLVLTAVTIAGWLLGPTGAQAQPPAAGDQPRPPGVTDPTHFEKLKKEADVQRKKDEQTRQKVRDAAQPFIDAQAKARGGKEQANRDRGASIADLNVRLPKQPGQRESAYASSGPRLDPGMRVDIVGKNGSYYTGTLVGIDGAKVLVQTIPDPAAKPSEFDLTNIAAIQTRDGIFAFNSKLGKFESALATYKLNKETATFERLDSASGDAFLSQPAKILGPTGSVWGLLGIARDGSMALGLPFPQSEAPQAIPAYNFYQIVTGDGVYTYDEKAKDFKFKSHAQFAEEARQQRDAAGQAYYDKEWARRMLEYQIKHPPVVTTLPYFEAFVTKGRTWPWWPFTPGP